MAKSWGGRSEEIGRMVSYVLCEPLPHPLECGEWDGSNVCSCVVKYIHVIAFELDSGLSGMDVFVRVAFFDI